MTNEGPWEILENGLGPWKRLLLGRGGSSPALLIQPQLVPVGQQCSKWTLMLKTGEQTLFV